MGSVSYFVRYRKLKDERNNTILKSIKAMSGYVLWYNFITLNNNGAILHLNGTLFYPNNAILY